MRQGASKYDLAERKARFGEKIKLFAQESHELTMIFQKITNSLRNAK